MSTVTQTPVGWSFIFRGARYEYPTREQAQEALYDLQHDKTPALDVAADIANVAGCVTVERPADMACPCTDYHCGSILIEVLDNPSENTNPDDTGVSVWHMGGDAISLDDALSDAISLFRLLGDPQVKQAIAAAKARRAA